MLNNPLLKHPYTHIWAVVFLGTVYRLISSKSSCICIWTTCIHILLIWLFLFTRWVRIVYRWTSFMASRPARPTMCSTRSGTVSLTYIYALMPICTGPICLLYILFFNISDELSYFLMFCMMSYPFQKITYLKKRRKYFQFKTMFGKFLTTQIRPIVWQWKGNMPFPWAKF